MTQPGVHPEPRTYVVVRRSGAQALRRSGVGVPACWHTARPTPPGHLFLADSHDVGKRFTASDGQPYWVTLHDGGFGSSDAVKDWCASTYPAFDPAASANTCAPRTLSPPHS